MLCARVAVLAIAGALLAAAAGAAVPDTARETRWAEQVVPQILVGDAVWLDTAHHPRVLALYTAPPAPTRHAVIVVHGLGVHPDWNLIGTLRTALAERGFATLSVQMPVLAAEAKREDYADLFPLAGERLAAAAAWLRGRGYQRIAIVSHSMGAAMANAWLARSPQPGVDAWVPIGMFVAFATKPRTPVLDVVAERDFPDALSQATTRTAQLAADGCSAPLVVAGTDHYFGDSAARLAAAITPFLVRALSGDCAR